MWSEICELIPLTTGLDSCIEHDIQEYQNCAEANRINGNEDIAQYYDEQINRLNRRKQELDNMNPFARWWHCEMQFRKSQREHQKAIKEYKKRMGIWW